MHTVMMMTFECLSSKEVISIEDGMRLGCICDLEFDCETGRIERIVLPPQGKWYNQLSNKNRISIPWNCIQQIGSDVILVRFCCPKPKK